MISDPIRDALSTIKSLKRRNKLKFTTGMAGMRMKTENIASSLRLTANC